MKDGISLTQPPHAVAQRSKTRGLPLKLASGTGLPDASDNVKSGAGLRTDSCSRAARISAALPSAHAARKKMSLRIRSSILRLPAFSDGIGTRKPTGRQPVLLHRDALHARHGR